MGDSEAATMEKYRDWADRGTGVNPFVPLRKPRMLAHKIFSLTAGLVLAPIRILVFTVLLLALWLCSVIGAVLYRVPLIGRALQRLFEAVLARSMLLTLGVFWIDSRPKAPAVRPGEILVCNYTSYADVLYLVFRFSPSLAMISTDGSLISLSSAGAVTCGLSHSASQQSGCTMTQLIQRARNLGQPVVLFPEVVRTNGEAVLEFSETASQLLELKEMQLVGFCHSKTRDSLPFPAGSAVLHLFHAMRQPAQQMTVKRVSHKPGASSEQGVQKLRNQLAQIVGVKAVQVNAKSKPSFLQFFNTGTKQARS